MKAKEAYELKARPGWTEYDWGFLVRMVREFWTRYRCYGELRDRIGQISIPRVLDVGCGVVSVLHLLKEDLPSSELTGLDPLMRYYEDLYPLHPGINWMSGYAESLPFADGHFDVVASSNVLDHVESVQRAVEEMARVVRPGGYVVNLVDVFSPGSAPRGPGHPYNLGFSELAGLLSSAGLAACEEKLIRGIPCGLGEYAEARLGGRMGAVRLKIMAMLQRAKEAVNRLRRRGHVGMGLFWHRKKGGREAAGSVGENLP